MRLIKNIEVGYFRSIYKEKINNIDDLTIFFGRNDSGKSNFLRSLNLFFNDCTNPNRYFDFNTDFNHGRLEECSRGSDTRKFVYIKITFETPGSWVRSLGSEFWVKKTWSISRGDAYVLDTSIADNKRQFLTRFLNKVKFHYIPAIKDRSIFESLLGDVYSVISENQSFYESLDSFVKELQDKTNEISQGLLSNLGLKSVIAPPEDLTELFRSLDFETKNNHDDPYSLTLQKGDGIQMRHIPIILSFLSDHSKADYHIWGFEEPENSLELASAWEEACSFLKISSSQNKQVFLTSHSPAFFSLEEMNSKRFFVSKKIKDGRFREESILDEIVEGKEPSELMSETPLLPIISSYMKAQANIIEKLECESKKLKEDIYSSQWPILFVEGVSDKMIMEKALKVFIGNNSNIKVVSCSGTTKMKSLSQDGKVLENIGNEKKIFVLVDNDKEGRELSKFESKRLLKDGGGNWVKHNSNGTYWCVLPFVGEFEDEMNRIQIPSISKPLVIENCFSKAVHNKAIEDGMLSFTEDPHDELITNNVKKALREAYLNKNTYLLSVDPDYKESFAAWVVEAADKDPEVLINLKSVCEGLNKILSY